MSISSAHKVLDILLLFGEDALEHTVENISQMTNMPISTVYRYVSVLSQKGFLEKAEGSSYRLGLRFLELSRTARMGNRDLRLTVLPSMKRIADQIDETVSLMRLFDKHAVCVESIEGKQVVRVTIEQGRLQPIYAGASSKVLLAGVDENEWDSYLNMPLMPLTPNTITDRDQLKQQIHKVREQGYAISNGEIDNGGRAVAVPLRDRYGKVVAALSIEGPFFRMTDDILGRYLALLQSEAAQIRKDLT